MRARNDPAISLSLGSPESSVILLIESLYLPTDGSISMTLCVKERRVGNT